MNHIFTLIWLGVIATVMFLTGWALVSWPWLLYVILGSVFAVTIYLMVYSMVVDYRRPKVAYAERTPEPGYEDKLLSLREEYNRLERTLEEIRGNLDGLRPLPDSMEQRELFKRVGQRVDG